MINDTPEEKRSWHRLTASEQKVFEDQADFLINRNYVTDKTRGELAQLIYENRD